MHPHKYIHTFRRSINPMHARLEQMVIAQENEVCARMLFCV